MKKFLIFIILFLNYNIKSDSHIVCEGLNTIEGIPQFLDTNKYFPLNLKQIEYKLVIVYEDFEKNEVMFEEKEGFVYINYGDGDQDTILSFNKIEYDSFIKYNSKYLEGFYEDGFWWSNGYNVRAKFSMKCMRDNGEYLNNELKFLII